MLWLFSSLSPEKSPLCCDKYNWIKCVNLSGSRFCSAQLSSGEKEWGGKQQKEREINSPPTVQINIISCWSSIFAQFPSAAALHNDKPCAANDKFSVFADELNIVSFRSTPPPTRVVNSTCLQPGWCFWWQMPCLQIARDVVRTFTALSYTASLSASATSGVGVEDVAQTMQCRHLTSQGLHNAGKRY